MSQPVTICARCHRALDIYTDEDGGQYLHTVQDSPADHEPVPVAADPAWRGRCDFCNVDRPSFVVPARDFPAPGMSSVYSKGAWSACQACALLVETNRWSSLERRAAEAFQHAHGVGMTDAGRTALRAYYRRLRKNITGSLIALPDDAEL